MHVGAKDQAMKFKKKFPTDRVLERNGSEEEDKTKMLKHRAVPRSRVGSITGETTQNYLFLDSWNWITEHTELQRVSAKKEEAARRTSVSAALHQSGLYGRVVRTETTPEKQPHDRLAGVCQMTLKRLSGLMRQALNFLAWIPIAVSSEAGAARYSSSPGYCRSCGEVWKKRCQHYLSGKLLSTRHQESGRTWVRKVSLSCYLPLWKVFHIYSPIHSDLSVSGRWFLRLLSKKAALRYRNPLKRFRGGFTWIILRNCLRVVA